MLLQTTPGASETAPPADTVAARRVGNISVEGNTYTDSARIVRSFEVPIGIRYSPDAVRRGIRKLFALGLFEDVYVTNQEHGDVVDLIIHVTERRRIGKIEFTGNRKRETAELEKKLKLRPGEPWSPVAVQNQVDTLLAYYHDEGFARAKIDAVADSVPGKPEVVVRFVISEGDRVRIRDITFQGIKAFPAKKLRKQMSTKAKGFFGGGEVKEEKFVEDREKIEAWYQNHGYRDAKVSGPELKPGKTSRDIVMAWTVEEGPRYTMGNVDWSGNRVISTDALKKLWQPKPGEVYDRSRIQRAQQAAFAEYAEQGYLYLGVEPVETVRDHTVDATFNISEGRPSNIRMVRINGNRATREKVIRREIAIHEGDRFKRSALVRTHGDIMRLGFFEDVGIDFAPADSTDVDVDIKVKEKNVGTASAGAGYTAEGGVTGFIELGHNNVLGNGQSLQLHLERGARRSDYFLSFTEPWFRDTPTLLGFSLFNTARQRDLYDETRRGGSVRIGRPLPWPDYSRGSMSYRLEDVTIKIDKPESLFTFQDSLVLGGIKSGDPVRTSSLELNFLRNSTDNPFYPKKGSRFTIEDELAGGPFGGAVSFNKHRIEGRTYFPGVFKGMTTMVRARVGVLAAYPDQNSGVPIYERFRLGGGTTSDPLRGYDDYQVVPEKFIRDVRSIARIDTASTPDDTIYAFSKVRYPGGRFMTLYTIEQQFPIAHPLHGVIFFDAGNTWDIGREVKPFDLKMGAGVGIRLEIPLLGNIGFDYGYGFNRDDGPRFVGHFLIGQTSF